MQTNNAFDAVRQQEAIYKKPQAGTRDYAANHYYWFGAESVPFLGLPNDRIERCRVTPVVKDIVWDNVDLIPMEAREPGYLQGYDPITRRPTLCGYAVLPGYTAEHLEEMYGANKSNAGALTSGIQGVVELFPLRGWDPYAVEALGVDELYFPEFQGLDEEGRQIDQLPKTYREMRERILQVQKDLHDDEKLVDPKHKKLLIQLGDIMLQSLEVSEVNDELVLDNTHACFERSKNDKNEKSTYDARDFRALKRLEQVRRDHALAKLATQSNNLNDTVVALLKNQSPKESLTAETITQIGSTIGKVIAEALNEKAEKAEKISKDPKK